LVAAAEPAGGCRLELGRLDRLEKVVSVLLDMPGSSDRVVAGRGGRSREEEVAMLLLRTTGGTGAAGLLAAGCHGEDSDTWAEVAGRLLLLLLPAPSRIPLIPMDSGGKLFGESL
jgi:hypothetical protein